MVCSTFGKMTDGEMFFAGQDKKTQEYFVYFKKI